MPLVNKHKHPYGTIALWYIDENPEQLGSLLTIDEFVPFKTEKRNVHWLAARLALQEAVGSKSARIIKNNEGKPFLHNEDGHISISHSGNMAAAIFNHTHFCGIDLELFDKRIAGIAHKFTTEAEAALFKPESEAACICLLWSAKESVFKYGSIHEVDFKEHIQLTAIDFESQCLEITFKKVDPELHLKVFFRVYEITDHEVYETGLLSDAQMQNGEYYIITWI